MEPMKCKIIVVYLDDIMIHCGTLADHVIPVCEVLTLLREYGLKAKHAKCTWACQKVDVSGFDIDKHGNHAQDHKTLAVMDSPQPENNKDVGGFLRLPRYYRKFIEPIAHIAMLLYAIGTPLRENGDIGWRHGGPRKVKRLQSPGLENASMILTHTTKHSAMLQSWLCRTLKPNIACTAMPASMHWAQCSSRCKIRQRRY